MKNSILKKDLFKEEKGFYWRGKACTRDMITMKEIEC
jgi:hypothetical protein